MSHDYCHLKPCAVCRDEGTINDQLDTIAKLRVENRDLKARLKWLRFDSGSLFHRHLDRMTLAALDLKNKHWRGPKGGKR